MNCFMGYNPLVAKEVKITTWIKEFDGESPSYPSFPNDGDCFVVFATDEDALTHNALSKKTYTNGDWADTESGSTPTGTIEITENGEGIDVSSYAYADVNVSGGSSDFSTATVTFNIGNGNVNVLCPYYDEDYLGGLVLVGNGESVDVLVYKDGTTIYFDRNVASVTGDIESSGTTDIGSQLNSYTLSACLVSGDGTITFS